MERMNCNPDKAYVEYISLESYKAKIINNSDENLDPFSYHSHAFTSIIFIDSLEGSCVYDIDDYSIPIAENSILVIPQYLKHRKTMPTGSLIHEIHIAVHNFYPRLNIKPTNKFDYFLLDSNFASLFRNYSSILFSCPFKDNTALYKQVEKATFILLSSLISANIQSPDINMISLGTYSNQNTSSVVSKLYALINGHFMDNLSLSSFAENNFISASYLSKLFKTKYGISPEQLQLQLKIEKACELLSKNDLTVKQIAEKLGFTDSYHFSKYFKKVTGLSPSLYRSNLY